MALERKVFTRPPAEVARPGIIWRLRRYVHGLDDGSRYWFLRVRAFLEKCNLSMFKQDPCVFILKTGGNVSGFVIFHVDAFLWAGFDKRQIIQYFRDEFVVGSEGKSFHLPGK